MGKSLTTEELFQDLKQFIRAEISGTDKGLREDMKLLRVELKSDFKNVIHNLRDELTEQINESTSEVLNAVGEFTIPKLENHERRITLLEKSRPSKIPTLRH